MVGETLRLGLLADNSAGLGELVSQLRNTPHQIACSVLIRAHSLPLRDDVDAWLLGINDPGDEAELIIDWLHENDVPYLLLDTSANRARVDNLLKKIFEAVITRRHGISVQKKPARVWVLAASTGGPEAVALFLQALGNAAAHDAFIYAQHIESHSMPALMTSVKAKTTLSVDHCVSGAFIEAGHIYVVDPLSEFGISESKRFVISGKAWSGIYQPSINQVIAKVARNFREQSGAVVFTGMGDDGAESCRLMQAFGGRVITQSLDSCTVDSMPRSVNEKTDVIFSGSIEQLANKVAEYAEA